MTSTFFPRRPPFPFSSSARKSTTYCISRPSLSREPVKGHMRPILIVPAARAVSPMRHRTNDRNRIFFHDFLLTNRVTWRAISIIIKASYQRSKIKRPKSEHVLLGSHTGDNYRIYSALGNTAKARSALPSSPSFEKCRILSLLLP